MPGPKLRFICINDVYSLENLPRFATLVATLAADGWADETRVVLAGDFLSPSMLSSLDKGRGMIDCLNAVGVTHVIFGNHEDDLEFVDLEQRIREFRGTWLNTNVTGFESSTRASEVLEVHARAGRTVRVGLLGVVTGDAAIYRAAPFGGRRIEAANECAREAAMRLLARERCAVVVPITHQPMAADRALAEDPLSPRFPVILGGHEHEVFLEEKRGTWIVKAGSEAKAAAIVELEWSEAPPEAGTEDAPSVRIRLEPTLRHDEAPSVRARIDHHMAAVRELEHATLLHLDPGEELSSVHARRQQTTLGTLLCSRLRDALGAEGCLFNGGGIRANRSYKGGFSYGDLKAEIPFDNEVVVVRLPGRVVSEAVAFSRRLAPSESGGFLQVDDHATVDPATHRILALDGAPLDETREYRIALLLNFFFGLDHIEPLVQFAERFPDRVPVPDTGRTIKVVLVDAFSRELWHQLGSFASIDADGDGRVTIPELEAAVARLTSRPASKVTVGLLLQALDANRDASISAAEADNVRLRRDS